MVKQSPLLIRVCFPPCVCGAPRVSYDVSTSKADDEDDGQIDDEEHLKLGYQNWVDPTC